MSLLMYIAAAIASLISIVLALILYLRENAKGAEAARKLQWGELLELVSAGTSANEMLATPALVAACSEAGLRAAECELSSEPLLTDPVAKLLCGSLGYRFGILFTKLMLEQEGWGKKSQVAARARIFDDDLSYMLVAIVKEDPDLEAVQVVCLGCGMDTRPWRLRRGGRGRGGAGVRLAWFELDQQAVMDQKNKMLKDRNVPQRHETPAKAGQQQQQQQQQGRVRQQAPAKHVPVLVVDELHSLACGLQAGGAVTATLEAAGFKSSLPTVWVMEGSLSGLDLAHAASLLRECSRASPPGSRLLASVVSPASAKLHSAFRHSCDDLTAVGVMEGLGWDKASVSADLSEIARTRYKVSCFPYFGRFCSSADVAGLIDVEHVLTATRH